MGAWSFLRTRVARRIVLLFVVGAVIPVLVTAAVSFSAVNRQLLRQSEERLERLAETAGQSVVQRLLLYERSYRQSADVIARGGALDPRAVFPEEVAGATLVGSAAQAAALKGPTVEYPEQVGTEEDVFLRRGGMLLKVGPGPDRALFAGLRLEASQGEPAVLWSRMEEDSIWSAAETLTSLPDLAGFCVSDGNGPLYCNGGGEDLAAAIGTPAAHQGSLSVRTEAGNYVVGFRQLFLKPAFGASPWLITVGESEESVYAAARGFAFSFPLALAVGVLTVTLLANVQIRRTMGPLEALEEGTRRIAHGDFQSRVPRHSNDEFGKLADSFNRMAEDLGVQFTQLQATDAIGKTVLTTRGQEPVIREALGRFGEVVPTAASGILLLESGGISSGRLTWLDTGGELKDEALPVSAADEEWLLAGAGGSEAGEGGTPPLARRAAELLRTDRLWRLPFLVHGQLRGALLFQPAGQRLLTDPEFERARRISEQAAVGLHQTHLLEELEEMSWGTIRALARAIDAKSKWTAGHSERVTEVSLAIGGIMGLSAEELTILERGGLLHDVGKIGVASRVLDTDGSLSPEDWQAIRSHPEIGARILEPVVPFRPCLPIVLEHHERWDGQGYPRGLEGEAIHPLARILAVADAFDAITSPRPYHDAVDPALALHEILRCRGTQFAPGPVDAFATLMRARGVTPLAPAG